MKVTKSRRERAKKSLFGRFVCKLMGDEKGAVMMEYVIVAVLIAAGCVVAVAMFGSTIVGMFKGATEATAGKGKQAKETVVDVQGKLEGKTTEAATHHDALHDSDNKLQ